MPRNRLRSGSSATTVALAMPVMLACVGMAVDWATRDLAAAGTWDPIDVGLIESHRPPGVATGRARGGAGRVGRGGARGGASTLAWAVLGPMTVWLTSQNPPMVAHTAAKTRMEFNHMLPDAAFAGGW